ATARTAGCANGIKDHVVADGSRHPQASGDRLSVLPRLGHARTLLKRAHDGRTAFGLNDDHLRPRATDPCERLELVERLAHSDDACAAAGGVHYDVRQARFTPATLLGPLDTHRLLAF